MKNLFTTALVVSFLFIGNAVFGQTPPATANTNLNVNLKNVFAITVAQPDINLIIDDQADLVGGVSNAANDHLQITATGKYHVDVKAATELTGETSGEIVSVGNVQFQVTGMGSDMSGGNGNNDPGILSSPAVTLSTVDATALTVDRGVLKRAYNVLYEIPSGNMPSFLDLPADIYTTEITYTLIPD